MLKEPVDEFGSLQTTWESRLLLVHLSNKVCWERIPVISLQDLFNQILRWAVDLLLEPGRG